MNDQTTLSGISQKRDASSDRYDALNLALRTPGAVHHTEVLKAAAAYLAYIDGEETRPMSPTGERFKKIYASEGATIRTTDERLMTDAPATTGLTFGAALTALKTGQRVARAGWNGKGMFAYLVPANSYPAQTGAAKAFFGDGGMVPYNAYLALKGADDIVSTWAPSGSDALAEDWLIVE